MAVSDNQQFWEESLNAIKEAIDDKTFSMWFKPLKFVSFSEGSLTLKAPSRIFADWIQTNYKKLIQDSLSSLTDEQINLNFTFYTPKRIKRTLPTPNLSLFKNEDPFPSYLNADYTFDKFVVGDGNQFAHAASLAVAQSPAKAYNPLFIYGGVGLGKTHLMQAIGNAFLQQNGRRKCCYISSERFTNQLINAIRSNSVLKFRKKYRSVDVLLIDDIHFIAGKESTEGEFFHTFNELYDNSRQIVVSCDRPPAEIPTLEKRLVSRFQWGLVVDIQPPSFETRMAILRKKAYYRGYTIPEEILHYIAEGITNNVRELEGALIRLIAYSSLNNGRTISLDLAKELLKDMIKRKEEKFINVDLIKNEIVKFFGLKLSDFNSKKRSQFIAFPRQIGMYLCRELTDLSLPSIGQDFGGRDHTTVLHAYKKIKERRRKDRNLDLTIKELIKIISAGA